MYCVQIANSLRLGFARRCSYQREANNTEWYVTPAFHLPLRVPLHLPFYPSEPRISAAFKTWKVKLGSGNHIAGARAHDAKAQPV